MASIEREVESALLNAVSGANIPHAYTSERSSGRLLPNVTAKASISNELLGPFTGVFSLSASLIYTSRADSTTRAGFDHEAQTIIQELYSNPSLPVAMTSSSNLTVYKASIVNEGGTIISANRTWQREISLEVQATASKGATPPPSSPVSLLLHMNGANNSTNFIDSSLNNFSVTANENAVISTAQYKFGGASGYFGGDGSNIVVADNAKLNFNQTDDFTIEGWIYFNSIEDGVALVSKGTNTTQGWTLYYYADNLYFGVPYVSNDINGEFIPSLDTWYFLTCTRSSGTIRLFVDGNIIAEVGDNATEYSSTSPLRIGISHSNNNLDGYVDDIRITKGEALYTANFTPPTQEFPNP